MARRVSWTNNSSGHLGTYVYRAPTLDPQNLPAPVATVDPVAQGATAEWVDNEELAGGSYEYAVQDFDGQALSSLSSVVTHTKPEDFSSAQVGDYIGGGVYAGVNTINNVDYHIVAGLEESEAYGLQWKTSSTSTAGTTSTVDGLANTQAMESAGIADHPAAQHCVTYAGGGHSDWHMPADAQITLMMNNLGGHPEFSTNVSSGDFTMTSRERDADQYYVYRFSDAAPDSYTDSKTNTNRRVRPIRRIPV